MIKPLAPFILAATLAMSASAASLSEPQLLRVSYHSARMNAERDYFVYLPRGFAQQEKWPVMLFLHGNGERGDGKGELDYVLIHGPLMEAWCQKRDLPFVIISPQMPMYDQGEVSYIKNRTPAQIPQRKADGINPSPPHYTGKDPMQGQLSRIPADNFDEDPRGWNTIADEVMGMVDRVLADYKGDPKRVYLTGLSYGGMGTWYLASKHPEKFAAIAPVVGYGTPSMAPVLAAAKLPMWVFAGGRDNTVKVSYFYPLLNELEKLGHPDVRFTIEADMGHDTWIRVYAGQDLYTWLLSHSK
ncbi:MAG: prolyl oligopeptidase family serine peptidase [Oleiharenicola lentus]